MRPIKFRTYISGIMKPCGVVNNIGHPVIAHSCDFEDMTFHGSLLDKDAPIMQCTEKLDINGKEIYEGDIVSGICSDNPAYVCEGLKQSGMVGKEVTGIVEYSNFHAQFYVSTDGITYLDFFNGIINVKVIGNKYEGIKL